MKSQSKKLYILSILYVSFGLFILFYSLLCARGFGIPCFFQKHFDVTCFSCGATRAFFALLRFDLASAIQFHPIFTFVFYPFTAFFIIQDYVITLYNVLKKQQKQSLASFLWSVLQKEAR